ncbi:MAG: hypothetical protein LBC37_08670 [Zoogloeaceae bacterium]|jgi:hypothetical protein|nr:hypothetical protein [Zoogloeaceae bacterium]
MRKKIIRSLMLASAGLLSACVTINIYFPAAAAEKMADKLIDDIWQLDEPAGHQKDTKDQKDVKDKESEVTP